MKFKNPILEGFSPDPSVCAVGDDFYLVTSTFAYFPGLPIYHSKDLVNWTQIGNALHTKEQLPLDNAEHSQGIFAPTIRYHDGTFYMITTNVTHGGNFIVTATNPAGPWSKPYYLDHAPGIDPSLFFDDNGKCYYCGTRPRPAGVRYNGDWEVWVQELDIDTMQLIGLSTKIWKGALKDVIWPEGPHIYKKDGYYYLMIAEGGTSFNHCVTVARSKHIEGPYEGNKNNPILTHRHLGLDFPVKNVGHGDLVETKDGRWFMTCLASRNFDGYSNLGRETFLCEVVWQEGWPVVNPGEGRLLEEQEYPLPPVLVAKKERYTFDAIDPEILFLRNPIEENYDLTKRKGWLQMKATPTTLREIASPTYIGIRQQSMYYSFSVELDAHLAQGSEAGIVILQNNLYAIRVAIRQSDRRTIAIIKTIDGQDTVIKEQVLAEGEVRLTITGEGQKVSVSYELANQVVQLEQAIDSHYLSTEIAGGFVGCTLGVYTVCQKESDDSYVDLHWLEMKKVSE